MQKIALLSVVTASFLWAANGGKTSFGQEAFMPDISLIGDFSYVHRDTDIGHLNMPGFTHAHGGDDHGHEHSGLNEKEGFNLNYAELIMQTSVDNYLDLTAIFHLTENSFEVEELYGKSRGTSLWLWTKSREVSFRIWAFKCSTLSCMGLCRCSTC